MIRVRGSRRAIGAALFVMAAMLPAGDLRAQQAEPNAGTWRTWVLGSGSQFRLPPPPDAAATAAEAAQLRAMAATLDPEWRERILWWDAVSPSYRWNAVAMEEAMRAGLNVNFASRRLAVLHTALADAMIAAWDSKQAHARPRPSEADPSLRTAVPVPRNPSYPDEHAVAGAVAAAVLGAFFPERAPQFQQQAEEAGRARLMAGVAYPSDISAGAELGRQVAAAALERARRDRSDQPWTGSVPTAPGLWRGANPVLPQAGSWQTWLLTTPDEFRPPPPAAHDSPERAAEMAQLRAFVRTPKTNADALFWEVGAGGLRNHEYWNNELGRLLLEHGMARDAPRTARAYALLHAAHYDAGVACWEAKFAYWTIRPFQLDPEFRTVFATPNHPSYPAAHACFSTTASMVLGHLFPRDAGRVMAVGREIGESRIWAGIHYPSDVAAGQRLAEQVAGRAIERARADGAGR